jgi:hypothetical protein
MDEESRDELRDVWSAISDLRQEVEDLKAVVNERGQSDESFADQLRRYMQSGGRF